MFLKKQKPAIMPPAETEADAATLEEALGGVDQLAPVTFVVELEKNLFTIIKTLQGAVELASECLSGFQAELENAEKARVKAEEDTA